MAEATKSNLLLKEEWDAAFPFRRGKTKLNTPALRDAEKKQAERCAAKTLASEEHQVARKASEEKPHRELAE